MVRPASEEGIVDTSPLFVHAIHLRGRHDRTCPLLRVSVTQYLSLEQLRGRHGESICRRVPTRCFADISNHLHDDEPPVMVLVVEISNSHLHGWLHGRHGLRVPTEQRDRGKSMMYGCNDTIHSRRCMFRLLDDWCLWRQIRWGLVQLSWSSGRSLTIVYSFTSWM